MIKRCGWKVTTIYTHFALEQSRFKRDFVLNTQHKRQKAKTSIEKDFYKLVNNANFGYDCRPIIDEVHEITYIKKHNLFDNRFSRFVNSNVLEQEINQQFEQNISTVKQDDPYKTARIKTFESRNNEELDALKCLKEKKKKEKQQKILIHK